MRTRTVLGLVAGLAAGVAVVALAAPVVAGSDALTTEIRVAADNPLPPETGPLPARLRELWSTPTTGTAAPVEGPTAVATGADRVAGLDPATGRERWSYRRGNARLCDTTLRDGVVVALFAKSHGCRDLVGLDAATGARRWSRTLELTTDARLTSGPGVAVATAGDQLIAVDSGGGLNRWTWSAAGCTLDPAVAGRVAVATVARCAAGETRLVVHLPFADSEPWVDVRPAGSDRRVVSADEQVAVLGPDGLVAYGVAQEGEKVTATPTGTTADPRLAAGGGTATAVADGDVLVVWTGSTALGVDTRARRVRWAAPAAALPVLAEGQVLLAGADGFSTVPSSTGGPATGVPAGGAVPAGAGLSRVGRLVLAADGERLVAYG